MSITVVYIDFSKAFDSVVHSKLLDKLASCGISGCLLRWIGHFLSNRTHQTRVGVSLSEVAKLTSAWHSPRQWYRSAVVSYLY